MFRAFQEAAAGPIRCVDTSQPLVALTFDDGPHPRFTPWLLEVLAKHSAHATFFMIGANASEHPDIVRQVAAGGHAIGNHSWDHPSFSEIPGRERRKQIRHCARALSPYGQKLFRPPKGLHSLGSRWDALALGYQVILWDIMCGDWIDADYERDLLVTRLLDTISHGSIVLLHDALWDAETDRVADRGPMIEAVDSVLSTLSGAFRFVTLHALLGQGQPLRRLPTPVAEVQEGSSI